MENKSELKWHQKTTTIILLLIFFFPLGLYFMWKNGLWSSKVRLGITGFFVLLLLGSLNTEKGTNNSESEELTQEILKKQSQVFLPEKATFFTDPWSAWGQKQTIQSLFGLNADKDKYGDVANYASGWVLFKMKLNITDSRKSAYLEIPFTYYSKNCWGNENKEGKLYFFKQTEIPLLDEIAKNSDFGEDYITKAKQGDLIELYVFQPEIATYAPKDACTETYASIKGTKGIRYFKSNGLIK